MKSKLLLRAAVYVMAIIFSTSCKKDKEPVFDYKAAAGVWVPYEEIHGDGTVLTGSFTASTYFGVYAESVELKQDRTYTPVMWVDTNHVVYKSAEGGRYEYFSEKNLLVFDGIWKFEMELIRFEGDELWLKKQGATRKFRRKI